MAINAGSIVAYLELDTSNYTSGFKTAIGQLKVFGDRSATVSQKVTALSSTMSSVGSILSKTVTVPLVGVGAASVKTAAEFEAAMSQVKAISGATGSEFEQLNEKAIEMGAKTKYSASESAEAFKYMAQAGWETSEMLEGIEGVMNLAAASGEELGLVSDIVTDSLTAFGLSAKDSTKYADILAETASRTNTDVAKMGDTFKYVAPVAGALGYSVEDTAVAIGLMANSGIKASQAGTSLRQLFTNLTHPVGQAKEAIEQLDISITNADGTMKPLSQTLQELRSKFDGMTEAEKAQYAAMLAGQEGMSGLLAIINTSQDDFDLLTKQINNSAGAAEDMAETMMDNTAGAVEQLRGALESAGIIIGNKLTPYIRSAAEWVTNLTEKFNSLSEEEQQQIIKIAGIVAATGPALVIGSKVFGVLTKLTSGFLKTTHEIVLFTKAIQLAKVGQTGLATSSSSLFAGLTKIVSVINPVTIGLTAGAAAVTALGVAAYNAHQEMEEYRAGLREETEEQKVLTDAVNECTEARKQAQETVENTVQQAQAEAAMQETLVQKLASVVDENGKILEGKQTYAEFVAGQLSEALGVEIGIVDGQITGYSELQDELYATIEAKKALAVQSALAEQYGDAIIKQQEAQQLYNETLVEQENLEEERLMHMQEMVVLNNENNKYKEKTGMYSEKLSRMYAEEAEELDAVNDKLMENGKQLSDAKDNLELYSSAIENTERLSSVINSGDAEAINDALMAIQTSFKTAKTASLESLEEQKEALQDQYDTMKQALAEGQEGVTQEMVDSLGNLLEQSDIEIQTKLAETQETLLTQFTNMGYNIPQGFIDSFIEKSPEVQNEVLFFFDSMKQGLQLTETQITDLFRNLGINAPEALIEQLVGLQPSVQASAFNLLLQLQYAETSARPGILAQLRDLGINVDSATAEGITSNSSVVTNAASNVGSQGNEALDEELSKEVTSPDVDDNVVTSAGTKGASARSAIESNFASPITAYVNVVKGSSSTDPRHAAGLDYVPFDGYSAILHKGERVLTAQENEEYTTGVSRGSRVVRSQGDTFNFYNTQPTPYEYARQMKRAKQELFYGI